MRKVLLTGADGFIGSWLTPELKRAGYDVDARPGRPFAGHGPALPDRIRAADLVIHLAAKVGRVLCEDDPREAASANAGLTYQLAKLCREHGTQMVYVSSSEAASPTGIYGLSKAWGEQAVAFNCPDALILRLFMPYGPGLPPGRGRAALVNFLHNAMNRQPLIVHAATTRSWCWIEDTCRGIVLALEHNMSLNIGRIDNELSMYDVAVLACQQTGADPDELIQLVQAPENVNMDKRPDVGPLWALGWRPEVELKEGMQEVHDWLLAREHQEVTA